MPIVLDSDAARARDTAKCSVAENGELDALTLLRAVVHTADLAARLPQPLVAALPPLVPRTGTPPEKVAVAKSLQPILNALAEAHAEVTAAQLAAGLLGNAEVRQHLAAQGAGPDTIEAALAALQPAASAPAPRSARDTPQRRRLADSLSSFGRLLTLHPPPDRTVSGMDDAIDRLLMRLCKEKGRCAVVTGAPGVGKSAVIYELARRIHRGDASIPEQVRELEIFELSPLFLRSGASYVGQYEERLKTMLDITDKSADSRGRNNIAVFVDEIHTFIKSGMHERDPFSDAHQLLKDRITQGRLIVLGCTTSAEYRHYIQPDVAWAERLPEIRLEPPSAKATVEILRARRARMEAHFTPLRVPEALLERTVELTDIYLPDNAQPRKSIQILDEACAICVVRRPPAAALDEGALVKAIEARVGPGIIRRAPVVPATVLQALEGKIVGQHECLAEIADRFAAGLGRAWGDVASGPRGVWAFCGPTGVGKTESALELARLLGGGNQALLRIDCNTLQGSGFDSGPAINTLLGAPPGYVGYVRGQGGLLSRVRDRPECIVLFDEIEKADPGVAKLLLQILDKGQVEDNEGRRLDFRRAFIIFTTNAGCRYGAPRREVGFGAQAEESDDAQPLRPQEVQAALRSIGYGEEFIARVDPWFVFQPLQRSTVRAIVERELDKLRAGAAERGFGLRWDQDLVDALLAAWRPRFGARHLLGIVRQRIVGQLEVASAGDSFKGVRTIRLRAAHALASDGDTLQGRASFRVEGDALTIDLA